MYMLSLISIFLFYSKLNIRKEKLKLVQGWFENYINNIVLKGNRMFASRISFRLIIKRKC